MEIRDAQREVRQMYIGGFVGSIVSAMIWGAAAIVATIVSLGAGAMTLVIVGFFIFPLTQLVLKLMGRPAALPASNPLKELAVEVAIVAPMMIPIAAAAALYRIEWFFPAMMIAVGAHYLPFSVLYGMRGYLALGVSLFAIGLLVGLYAPALSVAAAWATAAILAGFAFYARGVAKADRASFA